MWRCLIGTEYLRLLRERETAAGLRGDPETDAFMKASALQGKRHSVATEYMLRLLGLDVSAVAARASLFLATNVLKLMRSGPSCVLPNPLLSAGPYCLEGNASSALVKFKCCSSMSSNRSHQSVQGRLTLRRPWENAHLCKPEL